MTKITKIFWNGVKVEGSNALIKCDLSFGRDWDGRPDVTFYVREFRNEALSDVTGILVMNDGVPNTDDYQRDKFHIRQGSPYWVSALEAVKVDLQKSIVRMNRKYPRPDRDIEITEHHIASADVLIDAAKLEHDYTWAYHQAKAGNMVRRKAWPVEKFLWTTERVEVFLDHRGKPWAFCSSDFEARDWEFCDPMFGWEAANRMYLLGLTLTHRLAPMRLYWMGDDGVLVEKIGRMDETIVSKPDALQKLRERKDWTVANTKYRKERI